MENQILKTIMQNNPDMTIDEISRMYNLDRMEITEFQLREISRYKFSMKARERDYNKAIEDKIRADQYLKDIEREKASV